MTKPIILVVHPLFPDVLERLAQHFDVESNQDNAAWSPAVLAQRLAGVDNNTVARALGVSAATATRAYQRAVMAMREMLTDV